MYLFPSELTPPNPVTIRVSGIPSAVQRPAGLSQRRTVCSRTSRVWKRLSRSLPHDTALIGAADHGHCDINPGGRSYLDEQLTQGMRCWGDGRVLMFSGPLRRVRRIARRTGAQNVNAEQLRQWLGGGPPHPTLTEYPTAALLAPPGTVILPHHLSGHHVGHHGGITPQELLIPLLVAETNYLAGPGQPGGG